MFENDWILQQLAHEREREIVRQLQRERLIRQAQPVSKVHGHAMYHALDWIGQHLIDWGESLRARHAAHHTLNTSGEASHG